MPISAERLAEIKKICECVPFLDHKVPDAIEKTQLAFRELITEVEGNAMRCSHTPTPDRHYPCMHPDKKSEGH